MRQSVECDSAHGRTPASLLPQSLAERGQSCSHLLLVLAAAGLASTPPKRPLHLPALKAALRWLNLTDPSAWPACTATPAHAPFQRPLRPCAGSSPLRSDMQVGTQAPSSALTASGQQPADQASNPAPCTPSPRPAAVPANQGHRCTRDCVHPSHHEPTP